MAAQLPGLEIIKLWPSIFLEADLPDYEAPTERLIALAESRGGEGVFAIDDPCVEWLKRQVAHAVASYLQKTGYARAPEWGASGRFVVQEPGEYRPLANQPGADLSGMYVLCWPPQQSSGGGRDDGLPGYVSFYDPRVAMNMNAIKRDPYYAYHQSLRPRAGLLLLWPACVSYFLHPNVASDPAMRVAFDVQLHAAPRNARGDP
jgi:hypothetical protein